MAAFHNAFHYSMSLQQYIPRSILQSFDKFSIPAQEMSVSSAALLGIAALPSLEDEEGDDVLVRAAPQMLAGLVYIYI